MSRCWERLKGVSSGRLEFICTRTVVMAGSKHHQAGCLLPTVLGINRNSKMLYTAHRFSFLRALFQISTTHNHHLLSRRSIGRSSALNCGHKLLSFHYLTKYGVLAVEMRCGNGGDEELRSVATPNLSPCAPRTSR